MQFAWIFLQIFIYYFLQGNLRKNVKKKLFKKKQQFFKNLAKWLKWLALLSCMLCFHLYTHACFHLISNVHIIRTFENRITFQTLREGHNISYCYISYIKSETSHIWRTGAWLPFGERVEENHLYHLVKPNSILKLRSVYRGCSVYYPIFLDNGKIDFKSKIWNSNINFQT